MGPAVGFSWVSKVFDVSLGFSYRGSSALLPWKLLRTKQVVDRGNSCGREAHDETIRVLRHPRR